MSCRSRASLFAQALQLLTWLPHDIAQYFLWFSVPLSRRFWNQSTVAVYRMKSSISFLHHNYDKYFWNAYFERSRHSTTFPKAPSPRVPTISSTQNKGAVISKPFQQQHTIIKKKSDFRVLCGLGSLTSTVYFIYVLCIILELCQYWIKVPHDC